jgi:hypothetical protein
MHQLKNALSTVRSLSVVLRETRRSATCCTSGNVESAELVGGTAIGDEGCRQQPQPVLEGVQEPLPGDL